MKTVVAKTGEVTSFLEFYVMRETDEHIPMSIQKLFESASEMEILMKAYFEKNWPFLFPDVEGIQSVEMGGVGFEMKTAEFDVNCVCSGIYVSGRVTASEETDSIIAI